MNSYKVLIFGAGRYGKEIASKIIDCGGYEVIGFIDNYCRASQVECNGICIDVYKPSVIREIFYDQIILAIDWVDEVLAQLEDMGVDLFRINTTFIIDKGIGARDIFLKHLSQDIYRKKISGAVAEAGVFKGAFSEKINRAFPDRRIFLFDTFEGFDDRDIVLEEEKAENSLENSDYFSDTSVESVLKRLPYPENAIIKKGYIPETLNGIEDEFCFVNLDLDLYKPTINALDFFYDRVVTGGGILIHDYYNDYSFPNLKKGVDEFANKRGINTFPIGDGLSVYLPK